MSAVKNCQHTAFIFTSGFTFKNGKQYEKSKHNRWRNRYVDFRTGFCKDIYF